jgi:hypothetical protein
MRFERVAMPLVIDELLQPKNNFLSFISSDFGASDA